MRFNPRTRFIEGPVSRKTGNPTWGAGLITGFNLTQIWGITEQALANLGNKKAEEGSYSAGLRDTIARIQDWIAAGPQGRINMKRPKPGLYQGRDQEVTLVLNDVATFHQILTNASLRLFDLIEQGETPENEALLDIKRDARERAILTPGQFATRATMTAFDEIKDARNKAQYDISMKPLHTCSGHEIVKRRNELLSERRFRISMKELFEDMAAKRAGEPVPERQPQPPYTPPLPALYVAHEQRPVGPTYDIPTPELKIGDKLRPSIGRAPEMEYFRKGLNAKILAVIDSAYEVEVAGLVPTGHHINNMVSNQCYVGGGSGFGGISYNAALLFRAEEPCTNREGTMNQVCVLIQKGPDATTLKRFVMRLA